MPRVAGKKLFGFALALAIAFCSQASAATKIEAVNRLEKFRRFFTDFQMTPDAGVPGEAFPMIETLQSHVGNAP